MTYHIEVNQHVNVYERGDLGVGEVLRVSETGGAYQADVAFERADGRRLETFPLERLVPAPDVWERMVRREFDIPQDFLLKQLALQFPLANTGGELSASRTALLPHQILLTHDVVAASRRRLLIADEVGLGKTIETGMIIRELIARGEVQRVLVVCPAGLIKNWQRELDECFRLRFEVLGIDFTDGHPNSWEHHQWVIASIDTLKRRPRLERLMAAPRWDLVIFDEAHHLTRVRYGSKVQATQNYRLAEAVRHHTRDLLFLSATPHQGDSYQFWSLIQLIDDSLFESPETLLDHRGLLGRVMIRRTKREVTDADARPIFRRRQVHTQSFPLAVKERSFYERLSDYLREGYDRAGLGQAKTTSRQRAVGFVMATFQKIMASSPRAIRQALRRRLLTLLAREQMAVENRSRRCVSADFAKRILVLQEEMRELVAAIHSIPASPSQRAEADTIVAQVKQRLARRVEEDTTSWTLDGDEEGDEGIYAEAEIPDEAAKVRGLIRLAPEGTDRKFDTLVRALEQLRRQNPAERFVLFTQYRETLEFLREELGNIYGASRIATIKGGPLEDKIAAIEAFWEEDGARLLISTSAGGEGINLQVCRILLNYDLPWNPMAVEQRIGRIHRYGQQDTVQVYNLVAEDTVEERIYRLLEEKLVEIARTIGKLDSVTGEVAEDFRSEILGLLGTAPDYQDLYKKALVDRDYERTERDMAEAIERARRSSDALRALTQDLDAFNLEHYRKLRGHFTMGHLRHFVERAILRLGGAFVPSGELVQIEVPESLMGYLNVVRRYRDVTFDRDLAMRRRNAQLLGLGHPLVDALIRHFQRPQQNGDLAELKRPATGRQVSARAIIYGELDNGRRWSRYVTLLVDADGSWREGPPTFDTECLSTVDSFSSNTLPSDEVARSNVPTLRGATENALATITARMRAETEGLVGLRSRLVALACY